MAEIINNAEYVTCPECGYEHQDCSTWDNNGETHCDNCGIFFHYEREEDADCINGKWVDQSTYTTQIETP